MFTRHASAEMLFAEAERRGLSPEWMTRDGLFVVTHGGRRQYVYYTKLHGNSQLGAQICADKSLARAFAEREGFPNIPYCYTTQKAEINRFFDEHHPLIQKPLLAMKARGVRLIRSRDEIATENLEDTILERYVEGDEYRCLVLNGSTVAMQRKVLSSKPDVPWKKHVTNLAADAWLEPLRPIAESIAALLRMQLIAADFIVDAKGEPRILELNGMPGLHAFHHPDEGEPFNAAALILDAILGPNEAAPTR